MNQPPTVSRKSILPRKRSTTSWWQRGAAGLACTILFAATPGALWPQTEPARQGFPNSLFPGSETFGSIDVGYRWIAGLSGNRDMYRSIVNLGQGPKLLNANLNLSSPRGTSRLVDRFSLNASNWGGDPYSTFKLFAEKYGSYRLTFDYQNVNYFDSVPSFANPKLSNGILIGQHSYDTARRLSDFELILFPTAKVSPFVGYSRSSGAGPGITTFTGDQNEYQVNTQYRDATDTYRGGVTLSLPRFNLILEQKVLIFEDDQHIYQLQPNNSGNRSTPVFGQNLKLDALDENYHSRGTTPVTVAQMSAFPFDKLTISGRFVFSQPDLSFDYDRRLNGNAVSFEVLRFYTGESVTSLADAKRPHTTGDLAFEYHPFPYLSILNSLFIDRFHAASSSALGRTLSGTTSLVGIPDPGNQFTVSFQSADQFAVNINQNQVEGVVTLSPNMSFRGGYRYAWSSARLADLTTGEPADSVKLHRDVALAGFRFKLHRKVNASLDLESGKSSGVFARKDPFDFTKLRARGRYQPVESLIFSASVTMLDNSNPQADIKYDFKSRGYTVSAAFAPKGGERFSASIDYSRSDLDSDLLYIIPQLLTTASSIYRDNSHYGGLNLDLGLIRGARLGLGYGIISTTGTHPVIYHQPRASLDIPISRRISWVNEWRYFGLNDKLYSYEKFRNHVMVSSFRFRF